MRDIKIFFFFFCLVMPAISQTGVDQVQIKIYEFEEGLSHRDVYQVAQDDDGFLWVATANGLNRFDSKNFLPIPLTEVSDNAAIHAICKSSNEQLFLSLHNQLLAFDVNQFQSKAIALTGSYPLAKKETPKAQHIVDGSFKNMLVDEAGRLWLCSYDNASGLSHLHRRNETGNLQAVLSAKGQFENRATASWNKRIVFSYDVNTLLEVDDKGEIYHRYTLNNNNWICHMQNQGDSLLWALSTTGQLFRLRKGSTEFQQQSYTSAIENQSIFQHFLVCGNGDIWLAGRNVLWWYQAATKRAFDFTTKIRDFVKHGVNFRQVFEDQTGVLWVASDFGLIKLTFPNPLFSNYLFDNPDLCPDGACSIRGMTADEAGRLYISYYNSIYRLDPLENSIQPLFPNKKFTNPPFGILYHGGKLWTGNGLRIDVKTAHIDTLLDSPSIDLGVVMADREGDIWLGYRNRLFIYNDKTRQLKELAKFTAAMKSEKLDISFLYQSPNDLSIWVGTLYSGLYQLDKYKGLLVHYDSKGENGIPLLDDKVNGIYEDKNQQLWIATGKGLHQLDLRKQQIRHYLQKDGLAHSFINGLLSEGDSVLWLSTDNGLSRFSIANGTAISFKKEDGLTANEFNRVSAFQARNGRMYFGGLDGVNAFYPGDHFLKNKTWQKGKVVLTQFSKLDGDKDSLIHLQSGFKRDKAIGLSWRDRLFTFQFALANFDNPGAHQFSYKLDGLEKDWSAPTTVNIARYNTIPHGDYTFRVRARSGSDDWNQSELAIPIHIQQAFYKTWWFLFLCVAMLVGLILLLSQWRLRQSKIREAELQRQVSVRTRELEVAVKKSDDLLLNILPAHIAEELKNKGEAKARRHDQVTVFFSDFKGFSVIAQQLTPEALVAEIDLCFREFDNIMDKYHLEKIKTIGDAYMCAGGLSTDLENSALLVVEAALEIQLFMSDLARRKQANGEPFFEMRIGIHTGSVVSGIVGIRKFAFDIWGDTVNIAARLEENGEEGKVNISQTTYELVRNRYHCLHRGKISIKNMEDVDMYFVENNGAVLYGV